MSLPSAALVAAAAAGIASTVHCAAMCGPLALAACDAPGRGALGAGARYGLGRLLSYALTGALAGAAGARLVRALRAETVQQVVSLLLAAGLLLAAARVLRGGRARSLVTLRTSKPRPRVPALAVGLATGFLPCGALAAGLLIAAATASWWGGALVMVVFAAASAPGLLAVVLAGTRLRAIVDRTATPTRRRIAGVALVLAACWAAARPWVMPERQCHCHASVAGERASADRTA